MNSKKSIFWLSALLLLTFAMSGIFVSIAEAATTFEVVGTDCKDMVNNGIPYTSSVSIMGNPVESWRDRVKVVVWASDDAYNASDPVGSAAAAYSDAGATVQELVLYATSSNTAYQCQQLDPATFPFNAFSCNSFPAGATIARVSMRIIPKFTGTNEVVEGDYHVSVQSIRTTPNTELLSGAAKVDAYSTACAWNQTDAAFVPASPTTNFIFNTNSGDAACGADGAQTQTFTFAENSAAPFTIVSFPLGQTIDPSRFQIVGSPSLNNISYKLTLDFDTNNDGAMEAQLVYNYNRDDPANSLINPTASAGAWPAVSPLATPIKLLGGKLEINTTATTFNQLPRQIDFNFTVYYKNQDPTLGFQNSMFHFTRKMSVQFTKVCTVAGRAFTTPNSYDPCLSSKQTFDISLVSSATGLGMDATAMLNVQTGKTFSSADMQNVYYYTQRCANATCTTFEDTDAYVYRVYVSDGEADNRFWHYIGATGSTITHIPMKIFSAPGRPFRVNHFQMTAHAAGTYRVRAFYTTTDTAKGFPNSGSTYEFFVTIPQKDGDATCRSSGTDGVMKASWDGCKEDHNEQSVEFKAFNERYGFISNYSNQKIVFDLNPAISQFPVAANITELYCDWQVLADGYGTTGAVCSPSRIELPPMTRAIFKGGKMTLNKKPPFYNGDTNYEFTLAYQRAVTKDNMNLFVKMEYKECPREAIPDTGYSLRSPMPMSVSQQAFIFTGNSLQIPAIGLGMETPIPIVHINYQDGTLESGWNLKMLGGYIGELEGGAYLPFNGNSVLTGHYYSQGVFVNLFNVHLEDEIIIFGNDGMKYVYKVTNSFWTKPDDMYSMFQPNGEKSLTLVTCDNYDFVTDSYEKRYIVQATLESSEPYQQ